MVETTRPPHPYEDSEDRHAREVASMYGLTPKVEAAIRYTIKNEQWHRLRMLIDPLHPADKADFLERISAEELHQLVSQLGSDFDAEILPYLHEEVRENVRDLLDPDVFAASLPELDSDDVVTIAEELAPEELNEALAALPAQERVLVEQNLAYPEDSAGRMMQREMVIVPPFWTVGQTIDFLRSSELIEASFI